MSRVMMPEKIAQQILVKYKEKFKGKDCLNECDANCCRYLQFPIGVLADYLEDQSYLEYVIYHGIPIHITEDEEIMAHVKVDCEKLDGKLCRLHGSEDKPTICKEYSNKSCINDESDDFLVIQDIDTLERVMKITREEISKR